MPASSPVAPGSRLAKPAIVALLGLLVIGTVAGIALSARLIGGAEAQATADHGAGPFRVAQDVPTGFGFIAVEHAEVLKGLTPRELGGATHGIGGFVGRNRALVQASVTITNTGDKPLAYSPTQFRVVTRSRGGGVERVPLAHASVRDGELQPDAAIDARLSFVVPRDGSSLEVEFLEAGAAEPLRILLGNRAGRLTARDRRALAAGHETQGADHDGGQDAGAHDHTGRR